MALVAARLNAESFSVVVTELVKCKIKFSGSKKFSRVVILIGIVSFFLCHSKCKNVHICSRSQETWFQLR